MSGKCFLSHASEDKDEFVRPLAHALRRRGINVWYDEFSLRPGDSLRRSIDRGLLECNFGVVVLSPDFFAKEWPQRELDALVTAEMAGAKRVLPIWHNLDAKLVASVSPMLADKVAFHSKNGVEAIADALIELLPQQPLVSGEHLASVVESFISHETYILEYLRTGCQHRFLQIQAFFVAYQNLLDPRLEQLSDDELEATFDAIVRQIEPEKRKLRSTFSIPHELECVPTTAIPEERINAWMGSLEEWVAGTLDPAEADSFLEDLEVYLEVDHLYLLFGLPNYAVSVKQRILLNDAIKKIGTWFKRKSPEDIEMICAALRNGE